MDLPTALPAGFNQVLLGLACIIIIAYVGMNFWKEHLREKPIPSETYAKEADCRARHAEARGEVSILRQHVEVSREKEEAAAADRRKGIYDMIRGTETKLESAMSAGFKDINSQLAGINRALGRLEGNHE